MQRIVGSIVESAALFALNSLTSDEIANVDHVAQFADVAACLHALEESFVLLIKQVETVPRTLQS